MEASSCRWTGSRKTKGNETVYLIRDALTGRVLSAENVTSSETVVMKALLAPVMALDAGVFRKNPASYLAALEAQLLE